MNPSNSKFKSSAFEAIHESASALREVGAIDDATMREFDESCLQAPPLAALSVAIPAPLLARIEKGALLSGLQPGEFVLAAALAASHALELESTESKPVERRSFKAFLALRDSQPPVTEEETASLRRCSIKGEGKQ